MPTAGAGHRSLVHDRYEHAMARVDDFEHFRLVPHRVLPLLLRRHELRCAEECGLKRPVTYCAALREYYAAQYPCNSALGDVLLHGIC